MTSGIYMLVFSSGKFYIGQSVGVETRWKQHFDKFRKGTAAKAMQTEFTLWGYPATQLLKACHKDHLDMMESLYINHNMIKQGNMMLNSSIPADYTDTEIAFICANERLLQYSIFELMRSYTTCKDNVKHMQEELDALHEEGIILPPDTKKLIRENKDIKEQYAKLVKINQMLSLEASKSWWQRLFN